MKKHKFFFDPNLFIELKYPQFINDYKKLSRNCSIFEKLLKHKQTTQFSTNNIFFENNEFIYYKNELLKQPVSFNNHIIKNII